MDLRIKWENLETWNKGEVEMIKTCEEAWWSKNAIWSKLERGHQSFPELHPYLQIDKKFYH